MFLLPSFICSEHKYTWAHLQIKCSIEHVWVWQQSRKLWSLSATLLGILQCVGLKSSWCQHTLKQNSKVQWWAELFQSSPWNVAAQLPEALLDTLVSYMCVLHAASFQHLPGNSESVKRLYVCVFEWIWSYLFTYGVFCQSRAALRVTFCLGLSYAKAAAAVSSAAPGSTQNFPIATCLPCLKNTKQWRVVDLWTWPCLAGTN